MREATFIKINQKRWQSFEQTLQGEAISPDKMAEIFIQLTDDLSFARTQFPDSRTAQYLNNLTSKIHLEIYKNKKEEKNRFIYFWKDELPLIMWQARKQLLYSFIVFMVATLIGVVSTLHDDTFVRLILGDDYVNMTLENIKSGNPTAVYGRDSEADSFFAITFNNVMVSFRVFVFGAISSLITGFFLFYNGLMVGTFFTFFYAEGQFALGAPVVMLHGTIELSSIVIAGAAGFIMGNSILFPGTYSRLESFKIGAVRGLKIVIGLVPFFIVAGFIESFITRYTFMHWSIKVLMIGASAFIMLYYFIVYPYRLHKHGKFRYD
ncbi:MAG: stage II sporulation protein M [Bacteroidota bacterium]